MRPFTPSGAIAGHGDTYSRGMPMSGPHFRSESRNSDPGGHHRLGDRFGQNFMQHGPSDHHRSAYQTWGDQDDDIEYCRPRGSTIGDFDQDNLQHHRRRSSFTGNRMYGYGDPYGMGMVAMSASPREHMMRAQMMRGSMYGMDPMMGRMGLDLGGGYGGSMYGGGMGYGMGPSMLGPGSAYGYGPRPMMGMGGIMGAGYGGGIRPYRMSGFVDIYSPHLMRAKTWSAYGRMM